MSQLVDAPRITDNGQPQKATRKIAIVGKAPSSRMAAPYADTDWEIWGLSDLYNYISRFDRWFELHPVGAGKHRWQPAHFEWMRENQEKLYLTEAHPELPGANVYPKEEILQRFGGYFTNSVSWMIAMALYEGVTDLGVWGVDMAQSDPVTGKNGEYQHQRPSCEYFLGLAKGMGVRSAPGTIDFVPPQSDLCKVGKLYGFETHGSNNRIVGWYRAREKELKQRIANAEAMAEAKHNEAVACRGALDELQYEERMVMGFKT